MENEILTYGLMVIAGLAAGFVNTLAGSGSLITLAVFIFAGLPADVANGTNRLGVLVQSTVGAYTYWREGKLKIGRYYTYMIPIIIGALIGATAAARLTADQMQIAIGGVMFFMLFVILAKPAKMLREESRPDYRIPFWLYGIFLLIGLYGGFIMAGTGVLMLVALVLGAKMSLSEANGLKLATVTIFALPVFCVYLYNGQVNWPAGIAVAIGQAGGARVAALFAVKNKSAAVWTRRLLIAVVLISLIRTFELQLFLADFLELRP